MSTPHKAYDPARLRRAAQLAVKHLGERCYAVRGQNQAVYYVDLDGDEPCTCLDWYMRGRRVGPCKHRLAAELASGNMPLIQSLGDMLLRAEQNLKAHTRAARRPRHRRTNG